MALVGVGTAAAAAHLPALRALEDAGRVRVVGLCDPDPARREAARAPHPRARAFAGNDEMLAATDPDLLVIATPPSAHLGEIAAAAERGVHVLCEKPLGLSDSDAARLDELAARHPDLVLATVLQYRHAQGWRWVAHAAQGAIRAGEPFTIGIAVERPGTDPLSRGGWRSDPEHEGGILGDHAVHYLSLLRDLDAGCAVVSAVRTGPGGQETASLGVRLGSASTATIDVSYAGGRRANSVRLARPAQCLELEWSGGTVSVTRNGRPGRRWPVESLSDRAAVNGLYRPMYEGVVTHLHDPGWRDRATEHTRAVAHLLADALRLGRVPAVATR